MKEQMPSQEAPKTSTWERLKRGIVSMRNMVDEPGYEDVQRKVTRGMEERDDATELMEFAREMIRLHGSRSSPAVNRVMEKAFHAAEANPFVQMEIANEMMENGKYTIARTAYQELVFKDKTDLKAKHGFADAIVKSTGDLAKEPRNAQLAEMFISDLRNADALYDELLASQEDMSERDNVQRMKGESSELQKRLATVKHGKK